MYELKRMLRSTSKVGRALLLSVCAEGCPVRLFERRRAGGTAMELRGFTKRSTVWQKVGV